jgi:hypothetical protein
MRKTHSKTFAARHGRGMAWARHAMCESAFRNTDLFISWFTEPFLKHRASGKFIIHLDGHRAYYSFLLALQTAVENNVTIIHVRGDHTHILQRSYKYIFLGPFKSYFKNKPAACRIT